MNLSNKVAIVTGSARGIGRVIALKLSEIGADIVVNDIAAAADALESTANEIRALNRKPWRLSPMSAPRRMLPALSRPP
jgi:NAD(P)-dependent dehydrogenase (short-subunit alcohol dehydrogenase family)